VERKENFMKERKRGRKRFFERKKERRRLWRLGFEGRKKKERKRATWFYCFSTS